MKLGVQDNYKKIAAITGSAAVAFLLGTSLPCSATQSHGQILLASTSPPKEAVFRSAAVRISDASTGSRSFAWLEKDVHTPEQTSELGSTKACVVCREKKPFAAFYKKRDSYESYCKECKRQKRDDARKLGAEGRRSSSAKVPIRPNKMVTDKIEFQAFTETYQGQRPNPTYIELRSDLSFSLWEHKYGRPLSDFEKLEIKQNLKEFVRLLMSGARRV